MNGIVRSLLKGAKTVKATTRNNKVETSGSSSAGDGLPVLMRQARKDENMTKIELLKQYHDMACHNLFCYSRNYAMTEPKEGYEAEWKQAGEEVKLLEEMIGQQEKIEKGINEAHRYIGKRPRGVKREADAEEVEKRVEKISKEQIAMAAEAPCGNDNICGKACRDCDPTTADDVDKDLKEHLQKRLFKASDDTTLSPQDLMCIARHIQFHTDTCFKDKKNVPLPCAVCEQPCKTDGTKTIITDPWLAFEKLGRITQIELTPYA